MRSLRADLGLRHPARFITVGFCVLVLLGSLALALPMSGGGSDGVGWRVAVFTATSAATVTGLGMVDTGSDFSLVGQVVIATLVQIGGLGVMTMASIIGLLVSRRIGLRARTLSGGEVSGVEPGEIRSTLKAVVAIAVVIEFTTALILAARLTTTYDYSLPKALWHGVFHSVMAFNHAGFALHPDNLTRFVHDPVVNLTLIAAMVVSSLGFPVLRELRRARRPRTWSLHAKLTLSVTAILLVVGPVVVLLFEWTNRDTLGPFSVLQKLLAAAFQGVTPRSAGFNTIDYGAMHNDTTLFTGVLMFIGGGAASTGGGIRVTTLAVLVLACWAEIRGDRGPSAFGRRVPDSVVRQALTITLVSVAACGAAVTTILAATPLLLDRVLFEVLSAFGNVGLSTGITAQVGLVGEIVLIALMLLGRVGAATLGAALVLRDRRRLYDYPEGRPLVG
jgi:trk system potassium uptake protein